MLLSCHGTTHWKLPQLSNLSFVPNLLKNKNTVSVLAPPLVHDSTSANLDLLIQIYAFPHEPYFNFCSCSTVYGFLNIEPILCSSAQNPLLDKNTQTTPLNPDQRPADVLMHPEWNYTQTMLKKYFEIFNSLITFRCILSVKLIYLKPRTDG